MFVITQIIIFLIKVTNPRNIYEYSNKYSLGKELEYNYQLTRFRKLANHYFLNHLVYHYILLFKLFSVIRYQNFQYFIVISEYGRSYQSNTTKFLLPVNISQNSSAINITALAKCKGRVQLKQISNHNI